MLLGLIASLLMSFHTDNVDVCALFVLFTDIYDSIKIYYSVDLFSLAICAYVGFCLLLLYY